MRAFSDAQLRACSSVFKHPVIADGLLAIATSFDRVLWHLTRRTARACPTQRETAVRGVMQGAGDDRHAKIDGSWRPALGGASGVRGKKKKKRRGGAGGGPP